MQGTSFRKSIKRGCDILVSLIGLVVFAPVMALVALVIRIRLGRPVVFRQQRPGYKGRPFHVYKFRTMMRASQKNGRSLSAGERMGRLGKLLRKTSLDELPQLWNVLVGDMSLVGPRPLLMEYLDRYTPEQMRRHDMRPGITGLAQVNGRNALEWDEKFALDVCYVDNWSLMLDVRILVKTVVLVLRRTGVSRSEAETMPKFLGSGKDPV